MRCYFCISEHVLKIILFVIAQRNTAYNAINTYSTGSRPAGVAVVDINGDSKPDIVVTNTGSHNIGVLLNTGSGTFSAQTTYSTGACPNNVAVVDVNNDSKPDIIVVNVNSNNAGVLLNTERYVYRTNNLSNWL